MEAALVIVAVGVVLGIAAIGVVIAVVVSRSRARAAVQRAEQQRAIADESAELERRAGSALVRTDERIRLADDDLGFAVAEFGEQATAEFAGALSRARQRLGEAFQLNQLLSDHIADSPEQRREWMSRIVALCESADSGLEQQQSAFTARRATARRTPSEVERVRAEIERLRGAIPSARATVAELALRYSPTALAPVSANPEQAEHLLEFASRSAQVAQSRLTASKDGEADAAARAATETVQRAEALLEAVSGFEIAALRAEATLAAMIAESREEIGVARALPAEQRRGRVDAAIDALDRELGALPTSGALIDPVGSLTSIRSANTALDDAVAELSERAARNDRLRAQLVTAIDDAEQQIAAARGVMSDYHAPIGPDARTRLAEAERELASMTDEREPEAAIARARRAASLAAAAADLARADIQQAQRGQWGQGGQWGSVGQWGSGWPSRGGYGRGGYGRGGGGAADVLGGVIGGLAIGGLLDGLGDVGDLFDD